MALSLGIALLDFDSWTHDLIKKKRYKANALKQSEDIKYIFANTDK